MQPSTPTAHPSAPPWLAACGLPALWAQQPQWRVLQTGFGNGQQFLDTWQAWRADAQRPQLLHFVATAAQPFGPLDVLQAANAGQCTHLADLAQELSAQCWGLLPGVHRLRFDGGRVLLTLLIGDLQALLRQQDMVVDSIYLDSSTPEHESLHAIKALARCARRGTRLVAQTNDAALLKNLAQCGFQSTQSADHSLQATYDPAWQPKRTPLWPGAQTVDAAAQPQRSAVVIGAGIAGAACAQQLALRGWQVTVLDAASHPAAGASALPAGIFAPHTSSDDSLLSRISRAGLRTTVQWAQALLQSGKDWQMTGVLERRQLATPPDETAAHANANSADAAAPPTRHGAHQRPASWGQDATLQAPAADWSQAAQPDQLATQALPADTNALWHPHAGWLRPAALVAALLNHPHIRFVGNAPVAQLQPVPGSTRWAVLGTDGTALAEADLVVISAGPHSQALAPTLPLQPIRGQVSWGLYADGLAPVAPNPVNGYGSWVPCFKTAEGGQAAWVMGSSFERDVRQLPPSASDTQRAHADNWAKLQTLLPHTSQRYAPAFAQAQTWAQVRCASIDRLPLVGPLQAMTTDRYITPQICTAMGSRGLTWALLCAELLAARLHGEPLPVPNNLAKALDSARY